jgi:hypothetical protein
MTLQVGRHTGGTDPDWKKRFSPVPIEVADIQGRAAGCKLIGAAIEEGMPPTCAPASRAPA